MVSLNEFLALEAGDILFIDSSHVVAIGSDVIYLYLEVLPRLAPGVVVHAHDIFMPFNYPRLDMPEQVFLERAVFAPILFDVQSSIRGAASDARDLPSVQRGI